MSLESRVVKAFEPIQAAIATGKIPGAVLGLVSSDGERAIISGGFAQLVPVKRSMTDDTWFDLASLTKVIFTTPRILSLCCDGTIELDAPLCSVLTDLRQYDADCWERKVTFRECLGHQTPFPAVAPLYTYGRDADLLRAFVLQREWRAVEPVYSDINFILLGLALERLQGTRIRHMFPGDGFAYSAERTHCAATENCTWRHRVLCGEVHDDNCAALQGAGHAGLFGTAEAVLSYANGLLDGTGCSVGALELMRHPVSPTRTLGWERRHTDWSGGDSCSSETVGHTGFTGTGLWIDFDAGFAWTLLTNRVHPSRHIHSGIAELRQATGNAIASKAR